MIPKLTVIVSPPRCGSMWLYNAARRVHEQAGLTVKPDDIALGLDAVLQTAQAAARNADRSTVFVVKTHATIGGVGDGVRAATVLRDPRDMAVSLTRFMQSSGDVDDMVKIVGTMVSLYEWLDDVWAGEAFKARYVDIVKRPETVAAALRAALGYPANDAGDAAIAVALSPEAVARVIAAADDEDAGSISLEDEGVDRRMDLRTGFQTGHIGDRATGKWRDALSADDAARIRDVYGDWLEANDFPLD